MFRTKTSRNEPANSPTFWCEECDYKCSKNSDYLKHCSTLKHKNRTKASRNEPTNSPTFWCEDCHYKCSKYSNYVRHCSTLKHKNRTNRTTGEFSLSDSANRHNNNSMTCVCGKEYSARNSLWYHQKKCTKYNGAVMNTDIECNGDDSKNSTNDSIVLQLLQEQKAMREENKEMREVIQQQQEQHNKQIQELLPKLQQITTINNTTNNTNNHNTNNNTTNNTKFNLNFFLNEQCKDAISIQTFMRDLNIGIKELEHMGNVGYLQGMISIMSNTLCAMDIYKRPVHCTDLKRETIYIKDGDTWKKDNANNDDLKKVIDDVADVNYRNLQLWETQHPEAFECDTPDNIEYCKIALESLGGCDNNEEQAASKLKKIVKHVVRDLYVK